MYGLRRGDISPKEMQVDVVIMVCRDQTRNHSVGKSLALHLDQEKDPQKFLGFKVSGMLREKFVARKHIMLDLSW